MSMTTNELHLQINGSQEPTSEVAHSAWHSDVRDLLGRVYIGENVLEKLSQVHKYLHGSPIPLYDQEKERRPVNPVDDAIRADISTIKDRLITLFQESMHHHALKLVNAATEERMREVDAMLLEIKDLEAEIKELYSITDTKSLYTVASDIVRLNSRWGIYHL